MLVTLIIIFLIQFKFDNKFTILIMKKNIYLTKIFICHTVNQKQILIIIMHSCSPKINYKHSRFPFILFGEELEALKDGNTAVECSTEVKMLPVTLERCE